MQQRDDVWSRGYSECASWVPVVHIPPTDVTDSFRAPKRLKTPSGSHIHPNNTDYRLPALPAACSVLALVHEAGPAISPSTAAHQGVSTHFSWHSVVGADVSIHHWFSPPSLLRADWEASQHGFCQWVPGHDGGSWTQDQKLMKE